jgi:hypothetical protein
MEPRRAAERLLRLCLKTVMVILVENEITSTDLGSPFGRNSQISYVDVGNGGSVEHRLRLCSTGIAVVAQVLDFGVGMSLASISPIRARITWKSHIYHLFLAGSFANPVGRTASLL